MRPSAQFAPFVQVPSLTSLVYLCVDQICVKFAFDLLLFVPLACCILQRHAAALLSR